MYHLCKYTCICTHYTQAQNVCLFIKNVLMDWKTWNLTFIFFSLSFSNQVCGPIHTVLCFIVIEINVNINLLKKAEWKAIQTHCTSFIYYQRGDFMTIANKDEHSVGLCCYELYSMLLMTNSCETKDFGFKLLYVVFKLSPKFKVWTEVLFETINNVVKENGCMIR